MVQLPEKELSQNLAKLQNIFKKNPKLPKQEVPKTLSKLQNIFQEEATTAEARTSAKSTETAKHIQEENTAPPPKRSKLKRKKNEFSFEADAFKAWIHHEVKSVGGLTYLCATCKSSLTKGNTPCQAVANGLQLNHPDRPVLTELESTLIAHNINFQKVNIFFL